MLCPYCSSDVSAGEVEKEDGQCPVCGAFIPTAGSLFEDSYEHDNDFDDDSEFDDFQPETDPWSDNYGIFHDELEGLEDEFAEGEFDDEMEFEDYDEFEEDNK